MKEDKKRICDLLYQLLKATKAGADLTALDYGVGSETATARFMGNHQIQIDIAGKSGYSAIMEILRRLP